MDIFKLFGDFLKLVTNWATFVNYVQTAVIAAESDKSASGEQKRNAVIKAVLQGMKDDFGIDLTGYESIIETVINLIVSVFNQLGVFKHSSQNASATK